METKEMLRNTKQELMPEKVNNESLLSQPYNLYPFYSLGEGKIFSGYSSFGDWIGTQKVVKIDGYVGVDWESFKNSLTESLKEKGIRVHWILTAEFLRPAEEIEELVRPYLGERDGVWGKNTSLGLRDFYRRKALREVPIDSDADLTVILGVGAALVEQDAPLVYVDLPKNELLYRMRAGAIFNLGNNEIQNQTQMYKRFYFVDWVVLNKHKQELLSSVEVMVDSQWSDHISWMFGKDLSSGIKKMSTSLFRPRPWFDPGVWGGQWMKDHFASLSRAEENFAWSFEIIAPENGLVFESDGNLLEVTFDTLMFQESSAVLGRHAEQFGSYFPIRFDFLDTFQGGNLSIQCHPSLPYIQEEFGEKFTQDETYYIMDCKPDALVYLGFKENIDPAEFRNSLQDSKENNTELDVTRFIQTFRPQKHDFYLIPNQTVHSSGRNNMVLEISATPYIFTFKMYDWLQKDHLGNPRPINIERAFDNLDFERKGAKVEKELISKPLVLQEGPGWRVMHLPTHAVHYYDVHRLEFEDEIQVENHDVCHILMVVEGEQIEAEIQEGVKALFQYAETFIIPAGAKSYRLKNKGKGSVKVVKAFLK